MNEKDTTTKELKERTNYCEGLEVMVISLKEDLENSNKQNNNYFKHLRNKKKRFSN